MREKRQNMRFPAPEIRSICLVESDSKKIDSICRDISISGIRLPETIARNESVFLKLLFPPYNRPVAIRGKVAWAHNKNTGIKFIGRYPKTTNRIKEYISVKRQIKEPNFSLLLKLFSKANRIYIDEVFYTTLKALYFKQYALKKPILKPKMILYTLDLVKDYIFKFKPVEVNGELVKFMTGRRMTEEKALNYCCNSIPEKIKDKFGRVIELRNAVFESLYKDPDTGRKVKVPENYRENRAKRLPWIVFALKNTTQIYEMNERDWITYFYTMPFTVHYRDDITTEERTKIDHYLVVAKKKAGIPIKFVTAYTPNSRLELLKKICNARPYNPLSDRVTKDK